MSPKRALALLLTAGLWLAASPAHSQFTLRSEVDAHKIGRDDQLQLTITVEGIASICTRADCARVRVRPNMSSSGSPNGSRPKGSCRCCSLGRIEPATTSTAIGWVDWPPAWTAPISALPAARGCST